MHAVLSIDAGEAVIGGTLFLLGAVGTVAVQWIERADERKRQSDPYLRRCPK